MIGNSVWNYDVGDLSLFADKVLGGRFDEGEVLFQNTVHVPSPFLDVTYYSP